MARYTVKRVADGDVNRNFDEIAKVITALQNQVVANTPKRAAVNVVTSSSSGSFTTTSLTPVDVITAPSITTTGRTIHLSVQSDGSGTTTQVGPSASTISGTSTFLLLRDGVAISKVNLGLYGGGTTAVTIFLPPYALSFTDTGASAGSHIYKLQANSDAGTTTTYCQNVKLVVEEAV